jgi:hypothetical protein
MLTLDQVRQQRRRRTLPSLKQQYQEYILQRIESFKNSLERDELLRLGDEAVAELNATREGQFVLTEVLMLDSVDRLIMKRLGLRSYRRWRQHVLALRAAQREPTHWGVETHSPITGLLPRIEPGDHIVLLGAGLEAEACLAAAHDATVTFLSADLGVVERAEMRVASESLAAGFSALVVQYGCWFPDLDPPADAVVVETAALVDLEPPARVDLMRCLQQCIAPGGIHVLVPGEPHLAPEALLPFYSGWAREPDPTPRSSRHRKAGLILSPPACQIDMPLDVSKRHTS